jgi:hypothetical protein|tara:strand:- start:549 stop:854 length:306 start_codon:yes stop_codon:yes gene_type:complete
MTKIYPRCEKGSNGKDYALSAKGYLLPCCWCDTITVDKDPQLKKLFNKKLHIDNNDSVEEILLSDEWLDFKRSITKDYDEAPDVCKRYCGNKNQIKGVVDD